MEAWQKREAERQEVISNITRKIYELLEANDGINTIDIQAACLAIGVNLLSSFSRGNFKFQIAFHEPNLYLNNVVRSLVRAIGETIQTDLNTFSNAPVEHCMIKAKIAEKMIASTSSSFQAELDRKQIFNPEEFRNSRKTIDKVDL